MLFHVFSYRKSIQIFLFYKFFCTNLVWTRNSSNIFRSNHCRCSIKKLFLKILWYWQENTCVGVSFLLKLQAFRPLTVLKRDFNTYIFLWISRNLYKTPILMNICERLLLHFLKPFCNNILQIIFDKTKMKVCSNQSRLKKNVSYPKVLDEDTKD